jgi:DNA-binding response OmpR family regulator
MTLDVNDLAPNGRVEAPDRRTVLVVDDDKRNTMLIEAMLKELPINVVRAHSGEECLAIVRETKPDLIILDIMMPGLTGIDVCKQLRDQPGTYDVPIIFVTGLDDKQSRIDGKSVGGDDFLTKPIDITELQVRTRNLLRIKAYHDEIRDRRDALEIKVQDAHKT